MLTRLLLCMLLAGHAVRAFSFSGLPRETVEVCYIEFPNRDTPGRHTIRAPFTLAGRLIVIEAAVEGVRGNFILDTGSSRLILNSAHFSGGISPGSLTAGGTTGAVDEVNVRPARNFSWDSLSFEKLQAHLIDLSHIEEKKNIRVLGLIGYDVLKDFEILIDFQLQQVTLARLDEHGKRLDSLAILEEPEDTLDFRLQGHVITLKGWVDKTPVEFGLDSGAELNLLHSRVNRRVLKNFRISRRANLNGTGGQAVEVLAGKLYRFRCNDRIRCSGMRTLLASLDDINAAFGTNLDGLIGYEFLCTRRAIINYKKEKLYFLKWYGP